MSGLRISLNHVNDFFIEPLPGSAMPSSAGRWMCAKPTETRTESQSRKSLFLRRRISPLRTSSHLRLLPPFPLLHPCILDLIPTSFLPIFSWSSLPRAPFAESVPWIPITAILPRSLRISIENSPFSSVLSALFFHFRHPIDCIGPSSFCAFVSHSRAEAQALWEISELTIF